MARGKGATQKMRQRRLNEKRARKASAQAEYQARAAAGRNGKSKRYRRRMKSDAAKRISQRDPLCKNTGDITQFPALNLPHQARMLLLKHSGLKDQYTGCNTPLVRRFITEHDLELTWDGPRYKIVSHTSTGVKPVSDSLLRKWAAEFHP